MGREEGERNGGVDGWMDEECDDVADFGSGKKGVTNRDLGGQSTLAHGTSSPAR